MKVFVYGTLKRGYGNNRLLERATFLKESFIEGVKLFYSHYEGSFPVAQLTESKADLLKGEVWDLNMDKDILRNLDYLEGVPHMYTRETLVTTDYQTVYIYIGNQWDFSKLQPIALSGNHYEWKR